MKIFQFLFLYLFFPITIFAQNEHPFVERQINGFIYGSTSIDVNDFNNDSLQDILAYPVKDRGIGLYTNAGDLDFNLKHCWFNFDINTLSYADIYTGDFSDLIIFSDSTVHIAEGALDTFLVTETFNLTNSYYRIDKTHDDLTFIGLDSLGQLALISVDTNGVTEQNILGQHLVSSFEIEITPNDTSHIFTYSDSLQTLTHLKVFENSVQINMITDSLKIHSKFSTFFEDDYHIVCSSVDEDIVYHFMLMEDSLYQNFIQAPYSNTPIIDASMSVDTLIYYYLGRETYFQYSYEGSAGYKINRVMSFGDSVYADVEFLDFMDQCEIMISANLDSNLENEYILYSDLMDQITIYKDSNTYFNISRSSVQGKMKTIMVDIDQDGDLDGVSQMFIPNYPITGGADDIVYFENIGDYRFVNRVVHRTRYNYLNSYILQPLVIEVDNRPNVIFSHYNGGLLLRYWKDSNGINKLEHLDSVANSSSVYTHSSFYIGDLEGDGDDDVILREGKGAFAYQNRDSSFARLINTFGGGLTNLTPVYYATMLIDHDNDGTENAFLSLASSDWYPGYFTIKRDTTWPDGNTQVQVSRFKKFIELDSILDREESATGDYIDWNLDGYMDFAYRDARHGRSKESFVYLNNGDYTFDTNQVITYYTLENGDTVYPSYNTMYDFENNFKQNVIEYIGDGYKRHLVENDSTMQVYSIFTTNGYSDISNYVVYINDLDTDGDDDFIGPNSFNGASFYENITCNSKSVIHVDFCESYVSPSGTYTWTTSGVYYDVIPNTNGCDSTIKIHLNTLSSIESLMISKCSSYESPSGNYIWNESGIYSDTITNQQGCDSILIIDLSIEDTYSVFDITHCDSMVSPSLNYIWYSSGMYYDTITEINGCKTYYNVNLVIEEPEAEIYQSDSIIVLEDNGSDIIQIEWYDCNLDSIVKLNGDAFTPDTSGWYSAIISTSTCTDTLPCINFKQSITIADYVDVFIHNQSINLGFNGTVEHLEVELYNINGQLIKTLKTEDINSQLLDMSSYSYGIYIIAITFNNTKIVEKVPWVESTKN